METLSGKLRRLGPHALGRAVLVRACRHGQPTCPPHLPVVRRYIAFMPSYDARRMAAYGTTPTSDASSPCMHGRGSAGLRGGKESSRPCPSSCRGKQAAAAQARQPACLEERPHALGPRYALDGRGEVALGRAQRQAGAGRLHGVAAGGAGEECQGHAAQQQRKYAWRSRANPKQARRSTRSSGHAQESGRKHACREAAAGPGVGEASTEQREQTCAC